MTMWKLKSCLRCGGDLLVMQDRYGLHEECLQCGFLRDLEGLDDIYTMPKKAA